ncbi:hypothetical protein [Pedobacter sp. JCM 36344]|uniref:hypothetical protein n=1 Tax=Pedobacter sp. JCM 36344 TaxID=3374280 RepID=UPI00397A040A
MNNFFIYRFDYKEVHKSVSATVIFCDRDEIDQDILQAEIKRFYGAHYQTDKIFVLGPAYLSDKLNKIFIEDINRTFKGIPKRQETSLAEGLKVVTFQKNGKLDNLGGLPKGFADNFLNEGLQQIFIKRGGLVSAEGAHHFVFPSGKHCDKFLRTGNILLYSSEIYFIAFAMLGHFDEEIHSQIYCDTSSINSLAFALVNLKNRFLGNDDKIQVPIDSFSSYQGLYKNPVTYMSNALLLISASTSAKIITYILERHRLIERQNIIILFFLGDETKLANIRDKVVCNLTQSVGNVNGVPFYQTYAEGACDLCDRGSYPVEVSGDVFLLEKPHINRIMIGVKDTETYLSKFVKQFMSVKRKENVLKVNYKESQSSKYEIYIDYYQVLKGVSEGKYPHYSERLTNYINQYIPSSTRKIISLNDKASLQLAGLIQKEISANYQNAEVPEVITQDDKASLQLAGLIQKEISANYQNAEVPEVITQDDIKDLEDCAAGSVVVVGSCISNGKNLLYISRALRKFHQLRIVYFIGISRTKNIKYLHGLKSNLKQGAYGPDTNSFHEVETIFCENNSIDTSWLSESNFLASMIGYFRSKENIPEQSVAYLEKRKALLQKSEGDEMRGLADQLFFPRLVDSGQEELRIRKNFAFFDFEDYDQDVSQADIYFTMSNIINTLRNNELAPPKKSLPIKCLAQSPFVRNLLDPGNFNRFNDGIIQASILRAAKPDELAYHIDTDLSFEMYGTFQTLIKYHTQEQGEGLVEFLYALATTKLSLKKIHLQGVIALLKENCNEEFIRCFTDYIEYKLLIEPEEKKREWEEKLKTANAEESEVPEVGQ